MSSPSLSQRLFPLFLLPVIPLLAFLSSRPLRGFVTRTVCLAARAVGASISFRVPAPRRGAFQAPAASHEEIAPTPMNPPTISPRGENERWNALLLESEDAIGQFLVPGIDMDLASFIRCITFRVFLVVFLDINANTLASPDVKRVTAALTNFYDDAEGASTQLSEVQDILHSWLPHDHFPSSLDRILPAYEVLWRIIATIVVNCKDDETKKMQGVMLDFRDNPRERQYRATFGENEKSVANITEEVVERVARIARTQHASASTWPLSCIRFAGGLSSAMGYAPTMEEARKFAALMAAKIIGRIGLRYGISSNGTTGSQVAPWDQRRVYDFHASDGQVAVDAASIRRSHSNSAHTH